MFGLDLEQLTFVLLATIAVAALAYFFVFDNIEQQKKSDERLKSVKLAAIDGLSKSTARDKQVEATRRRK